MQFLFINIKNSCCINLISDIILNPFSCEVSIRVFRSVLSKVKFTAMKQFSESKLQNHQKPLVFMSSS